jgi:hypothetical protein
MGIVIRPFTTEFVPAVRELNARLLEGGVDPAMLFPEQPVPTWLPAVPGRRIYQDFFLAVDGEAVRGAFIVKHQPFSVAGAITDVPYYHGPISEGIVNKAYAMAGVQMLRTVLKADPRLFALGMGGFDKPLPSMLKAMGWSLDAVPFYFFVNRPARFFSGLRALHRTPLRTLAMKAAGASGAGWVAMRVMQRHVEAPAAGLQTNLVSAFSAPALDELWDRVRSKYALIGARDRDTLQVLYPASDARFLRLEVRRKDALIGWAVMLATDMRNDKYFGDLRVGSIIDVLADPADAHPVIAHAKQVLTDRRVDVIVTNQSHEAWTGAVRRCGFLAGPSNFIFAASQALSKALGPGVTVSQCHWTRGDGDGPIHL